MKNSENFKLNEKKNIYNTIYGRLDSVSLFKITKIIFINMVITQQLIEAVWNKALSVPGYNPEVWRQDFAKAWINKNAYGTTGPYGWEIDHRIPLSKKGSDDLSNLFPCQWENNRSKGDDYPKFKTKITNEGNRNVQKEQLWVVK
jgi:hypothetical protein